MIKSHDLRNVVFWCYFCLSLFSMADERIESDLEIFLYNDTDSFLNVFSQNVSFVWNENESLTDLYQTDTVTISAYYVPLESGYDTEYGYNYIYTGVADGSGPIEIDWADLGYGLYKIWVEPSDINTGSSFYIDLRDANMAFPIDIDLLWDGSHFTWRHALDGGCGTPVWAAINNNDVKQIWNMWGGCAQWKQGPPASPNTTPFQPATPANLQVVPYNNHPKLTWDHSEPLNGNVTYTV